MRGIGLAGFGISFSVFQAGTYAKKFAQTSLQGIGKLLKKLNGDDKQLVGQMGKKLNAYRRTRARQELEFFMQESMLEGL